MSHRLSTKRGKSSAVATRAPDPSRRATRPLLKILLVAAIAVLGLAWIASPATAQECAITDLECLNDQVEETVDAVGEAAGGAADTISDTAEDAAETVEGILNDTTDKGREIIDGLLGRGGKNPGEEEGKDKGRSGGGSARTRDRDGLGRGLLAPRDPSLTASASADATTGGRSSQTPDGGGGLGRGIANAARDLAFPVLLVGLVLGFLALQNRLDRRDPKLAAAPLGPDFLTFD